MIYKEVKGEVMKDKSKKTTKIKMGVIIGILILIVLIFLLIKGCAIKKYTVKFDSDGGTIVKAIEVKENEKIKKPKDPTKDGYYFDGWYYKNKLFNFNTKITKNITLKAHWSNGINLNKKMVLNVGQQEKIEILKLPNGLSEKDLIYSSSDESIAIVDKNGNIKGLKKGKVVITVKSKDGKYTSSIEVTITEEEIVEESSKKETEQTTSSSKSSTKHNTVTKSNNGNSGNNGGQQQEQPKEPSYIIYLTKRELAVAGGAIQYDFRVEKDGSNFTDYLGFTYNGTQVGKNQGSISSTVVNSDGSQASLKLSNGTVVTATVVKR